MHLSIPLARQAVLRVCVSEGPNSPVRLIVRSAEWGLQTVADIGRRTLIGSILMSGNMPGLKAATDDPTKTPPPPSSRMSPLFARGASIVDQHGDPVMLHGIGWFEGCAYPGWLLGLDQVNWKQTLLDMMRLGFNCVRMHTFQRGVLNVMSGGDRTWPMWHGLNKTLNADLVGLGYLQVIDKVLDFAATIGLRVLIDSHSSAGSLPNNAGRWAVGPVSDADFARQWLYMANRWRDKPALVGYELINEPQRCTWGDGGANDICKMYSDVGSAILAIDPRPLIVCQGTSVWGKSARSNLAGTYTGIFSEADLSLVQTIPVTCPVPAGAPPGTTKVCYSAHDYPVPWNIGAELGRGIHRKDGGMLGLPGDEGHCAGVADRDRLCAVAAKSDRPPQHAHPVYGRRQPRLFTEALPFVLVVLADVQFLRPRGPGGS